MNLDMNNMIIYMAAILLVFILGKLLIVPLKTMIKLLINSLLGGVLIFLINVIGAYFNFHIGLNMVTSLFVGLLGIPGAVVMILIKIILG